LTYGASQSGEGPIPGNSTARATAEALFRHLRLLLGVFAAILLGTVLWTIFTPATYESEMNVLVRNARPDYLLSPERSNGQLTQNEVTEERVGSEMDVIRSRDLADAVVDPNWLKTPLAERSSAEVKAHDQAITAFEKHLYVESLKKSNVIRVAYDTTDPRQANETLTRLLNAFLAKQRDIERSTGASAFFAAEATRYKNDLDQAEQALAAFQQNNQIVQIGPRESTLQTQIDLLDDSLRAAQVQTTEAENRVASDKHQMALQPARQATSQRSVPQLETIQQLTAILTNYQNKRTELLTRYQPTDRLMIEVNKQIDDTAAALATARANNGQEATTDVNPVYQQLKANLSTSMADLAALRGRLSDLTAQRDTLKRQLSEVEGSAVEYTTLQSRVTELEGNYQLYTQKKNEAGIADAMNRQQLVNVAIAEQPTFSNKRVKPQIAVNLALGLFTGLFLGGCAVFFAEVGRETIAAPWELEEISRAPVLATVPLLSGGAGYDRGMPRPPRGERVHATSDLPPSPEGGIPGRQNLPSNKGASSSLKRAVVAQTAVPPGPGLAEAIASLSDVQEQSMNEPKRLETALPGLPPRDATVMRRAAVQSYEELVAHRSFDRGTRNGEPVARDPLAHPISPPRPPNAARPIIESSSDPVPGDRPAPRPQFVPARRPRESASTSSHPPLEPIEPRADLAQFPMRPPELVQRARLTPSQRAVLQRRGTTRDRNGRQTDVTYTATPPERK
jgi:uncharacterized protein involved in exopolysaccharide biosynthesis